MTSSPTYAVRIRQHGDNDDLWYVFTITSHGFRHDFGHDLDESVARSLHAELSELNPITIAWLAGKRRRLAYAGSIPAELAHRRAIQSGQPGRSSGISARAATRWEQHRQLASHR